MHEDLKLHYSIRLHEPSFFDNYLWRRDELEPKRRDGSSLRDVAHDGVLCPFNNRTGLDRGKWCRPSGQAAWTVHHVQSHTPASQAGRRDVPAL